MSDCEELRQALSVAAELEPRLVAHAEKCPSCAWRLKSPLSSGGQAEVISVDAAALWRGMPEALAREGQGAAPLRNLETFWRVAFSFAGLGALTLAVWEWGGREDAAALPWGAFLLRWAPGVGAACVCAWLLLRPGYRRDPPPWLGPGLLFAAVAVGAGPALLPELHRAHPASLLGVGSDLAARAAACFGIGLLLGGACLAWVILFAQGPRRLGLLPLWAGALVVLGSSSLLSLHCPLTAPLHLALGHASVGLVVAAVALSRWWR